ncbi:MAG TPA: ATPase domain-containing protein [Pyrinomonadaceae bacterium]|nr:ATPase domain-containing protein [Pyrinomonadaceae bacterium]
MPATIRFGIESLDKLIGAKDDGIGMNIPKNKDGHVLTTSLCLIGPDGTGKSVLALHLAAQYLSDCRVSDGNLPKPKILYISTDLTQSMAETIWDNFDLRHPLERKEPFATREKKKLPETLCLGLAGKLPKDMNSVLAKTANDGNEVYFVDLAQATAGDDWGFVHRIMSVLDLPTSLDAPRHMVVIDAVEGFETLVGDLNAFGEKSTRRARIAQVMRLAAKKCHLLFVVEETKDERLPEEFVTDAVIRLRNTEINGYVRRTIEIEKTRGQTHVRGQHLFVTRSGGGSTTGSDANVNQDDPREERYWDVRHPCKTRENQKSDAVGDDVEPVDGATKPERKKKLQSYVQVFTSINHLSRLVMETQGQPRMEPPKDKYAGFGIPNLDSMLGGDAPEGNKQTGGDKRGLPCSRITALIGDALTQKSQLGRAFLGRAFYPFAKALADKVIKDFHPDGRTTEDFEAGVRRMSETLGQAPLRKLNLNGEPEPAYPSFIADDFRDKSRFIKSLKLHDDRVSPHLYKEFRQETRRALESHDPTKQPKDELVYLLVGEFNRLLEWDLLSELIGSAGVRLSEATETLKRELKEEFKQEKPGGEGLRRLNRLLLEDAYLQSLAVEKVPGVAVLMTTQDTHSEELAKEFLQWLNVKSLLGPISGDKRKSAIKSFETVLYDHIKRNTICRRMEIHDMSSPVIAHIFQRNIEAAQKKLFGKSPEDVLPEVRGRFQVSWRIRMVIDDFNAFRNTFPDIHKDPLLLPFLLFHLRREGISTLILDTQSGKPDIALSERFESSLREAADYRLYTWRIPFYGETRVGITAIPPLSLKNRGLIRELRGEWVSGGEKVDRNLTVDPHFELYAGLERGNPHPVPLEVRLYPGTPTLIKYIEDENTFFKELFVPHAEKSDVIVGFDPPKYESFREFCYLQRDTRLDHTLVFQVDEFWLTWLTRQSQARMAGILQRQWSSYLNAITVDANGEPDRAADAYYLFQKTFEQTKDAKPDMREPYRRWNFYDNERLGYGFDKKRAEEIEKAQQHAEAEATETARSGYADDKQLPESEIDRVPFCWDFAFAFCRENLWTEYMIRKTKKGDRRDNRKRAKVVEVWNKIPKAKSRSKATDAEREEANGNEEVREEAGGKVSWRDFLEACKEVGEYHSAKLSTPIPAFDFSLNDGEAFSCLVLEIWLSEIYETKKKQGGEVAAGKLCATRHERFAHLLSQKIWDRADAGNRISLLDRLTGDLNTKGKIKSLGDILQARREGEKTGYSLELYKAWLLLTEVIDFTDLLNTPHNYSFEFKSRQSNPAAVASHHWYQSACDLIEQHHLAENLVAVRLPGHFSVRGDWFLAVAGGSRSSRLAHRAMDLLGSRRANTTRLQLGIGLPVRNPVEKESDFAHVRTRLISTDDETGRLRNVTYEELLKIAGRTKPAEDDETPDKEFYWLWRSSLYGYARCSRVWQKWLTRMALWWQTIHARHKSNWAPGFELYDAIDDYLEGKRGKSGKKQLESFSKYESWERYPEMVNILLMELQQVSFGHERDEAD